jgi:hypothetical protein
MAFGKQTSATVSTLDVELAVLFGEDQLQRARTCKVEELKFSADEIVQAARAMRRCTGKPAEQIELARGLPDDVQTAFCMWLLDPDMQAKVLAAAGIRLQ